MSPIERPVRIKPPSSGNEKEILWPMLDFYRETLVTICAGLSDDQLRTRAIPPSNLSLIGILRHMADVEVYWFGYVFAGVEVTYAYDPEMVGADFDNLDESPGEYVGRTFHGCVAQSNVLTSEVNLDTLSVHQPGDNPVDLRFIVVHMIEEYARHCGHADLLREVIDGETGH
jgi:uncharacterized damage-inducible protein DinB